ncbi:MAG: exosortase [Calditrichaeota bacterium]|nr:MAG: exosortase [Calditrichota bacterium]
MKIETDKILAHLKKHKYPYILVVMFSILNIRVITDLVADWIRDDNYSHGFFMIPISAYLFYRKKEELKFPAEKSKIGILLLCGGLLLLVLGTAASEFFATRVGFVTVLTGITLTYVGNENFKKVWFPFFFLLFMIPIPSIIYYAATIPMQLFATKVTYVMLKTIGVPIMRNGNILMLPDYALEVVEACSGLRSLVTLMALGALYAYFRMPGKVLPTILFF